jgi:hypothetical protein
LNDATNNSEVEMSGGLHELVDNVKNIRDIRPDYGELGKTTNHLPIESEILKKL